MKDEQLKEAETMFKQKQEMQIDQINILNKGRIKSEREVDNIKDEMKKIEDVNDKLQQK
jgi:hypothetical protein